jgi:hypothetical protein
MPNQAAARAVCPLLQFGCQASFGAQQFGEQTGGTGRPPVGPAPIGRRRSAVPAAQHPAGIVTVGQRGSELRRDRVHDARASQQLPYLGWLDRKTSLRKYSAMEASVAGDVGEHTVGVRRGLQGDGEQPKAGGPAFRCASAARPARPRQTVTPCWASSSAGLLRGEGQILAADVGEFAGQAVPVQRKGRIHLPIRTSRSRLPQCRTTKSRSAAHVGSVSADGLVQHQDDRLWLVGQVAATGSGTTDPHPPDPTPGCRSLGTARRPHGEGPSMT